MAKNPRPPSNKPYSKHANPENANETRDDVGKTTV